MSDRLLLATFEHEDDLLEAVAEARRRDYSIVDVFTPYAIHGLDRAMGLKPSRLTWVCFICAMIGAIGMLWFQHWTAAVSWPIDVGGKPWNALPSDVPPAFEMAVLLAGFGSVFALFAVSRLFPGKRGRPPIDRATDDQFVIVLDEADASFNAATAANVFEEFNVVDVQEHVLPGGGLS